MDEDRILSLIEGGMALPSAPVVVTRVLEIATDPNGTLTELEEAIRGDTGLVSRILRMANSAYYRRVEKVKTVKQAISVLGFRAITNLVIAASTRSLYAPFGLHENMLWEHSVGAALASAFLASEFRLVKPDEALVAGLMHDIGKCILNTARPEEYRKVAERVYNQGRTYFESEREILGLTHCDVGAALVRKWNFPIEFGKVIHYHHRLAELQPGRVDPSHLRFIALVDLANRFMHRLGIGYRSPSKDLPLGDLEAWSVLDIQADEVDVDGLSSRIEANYLAEKTKFD